MHVGEPEPAVVPTRSFTERKTFEHHLGTRHGTGQYRWARRGEVTQP
jgi:hypothetical protein